MENTKLDLKKVQKELFNVKEGEYKKVYCEKAYYIALDGIGNPNENDEYMKKVTSLYKLAYGLKMMHKKQGLDFVVMPLSGLWWSDNYEDFVEDNKERWQWTMMIQVPKFINSESVENKKKEIDDCELSEYIREIRYMEYEEGEAYETLYVGPYSEERETIEKLHSVIRNNGYSLNGKHHEIYLSDPRKTKPEKLKTIIRQGYKIILH